ncbi:hypothetical protein A9Q84_12555 [Halobacteriovorax marinus]|uniref:Uncharacterized protein n=1 Tax=Halobacteriovorax marinus TaxID=97084 RepID=A0A1Y5FCG9_9BACT|nr:hypothetical protein A9Q84_12555 [Halobacteriovorax marinus]
MAKKYFSKEKIKEMKGFEEIMDLVIDEEDQVEVEKKRKEIEKYNDTYQLYNFLENENARLEKLALFFGKKLNNYQKFNQTNLILEKQSTKCSDSKSELIKKLVREDSHINNSLSTLFNTLF